MTTKDYGNKIDAILVKVNQLDELIDTLKEKKNSLLKEYETIHEEYNKSDDR